MNFNIIIPSNKPERAAETHAHLRNVGYDSLWFNGDNYPSFSKLINDSVLSCPSETVIICNDKARPRKQDIEKTLSLLDSGYGFVGLYCFGFFGFRKQLFRQIGPLDERFLGGNYEDCDFLRRLNEANIACYMTYEAPYLELGSSWNTGLSKIHFDNKWIDAAPDNLFCKRLLSEEDYNYDFGPAVHTSFKPWKESHIPDSAWFLGVEILQNEN